MATSHIKRIEIHKLWGKHDIVWDNLNPDVNILVGINGSGKSTLLSIVNSIFLLDKKAIQKFGVEKVYIQGNDFRYDYPKNTGITYDSESEFEFDAISTFDVPVFDKTKLRQNESPLMFTLRQLILQTGANSFNDFRLRATTSPEKAIEIPKKINHLFNQINSLFANTNKTIEINASNNIVFRLGENIIQLEELSSGEKQLLIILFKVFLMDQKTAILLMDEPEISLHISWQQDLIRILRDLNPNCQLIIATHSPSIFGKGWGDKITFMDNLLKL